MNEPYKKTPSNEIGSYQSPVLSTEYAEINKAYMVSELPTNSNSTKQAAPSLPANQDSPAKVGNLSC